MAFRKRLSSFCFRVGFEVGTSHDVKTLRMTINTYASASSKKNFTSIASNQINTWMIPVYELKFDK